MRRPYRRAAATSVAVVTLATGAAVWAGQSGAAAAAPGYVGIVIAGHGYECVPWHPGITGDRVLNVAASVNYRPRDGLIVQIDDDPSSPKADVSHYWSYWHDTGSSWQYSDSGASGYSPAAGSVEGWSYVDGGTASPPAQGAVGLYAAICGSRDVTQASHSAKPGQPRSKSKTTPEPKPAVRSRSDAVRSATGSVGSTTNRSALSSAAAARPASSATVAASTPVGPANPSPPASNVVSDLAALPPRTKRPAGDQQHSSGSVLPVVIGLALALVLGGGAGWTVLRRRRAESAEQ
jgi:hypothetical protein